VAERAGTSHSFISKLEAGNHIPTIPVLKRILAVLDEALLIGIERRLPDEEREPGRTADLCRINDDRENPPRVKRRGGEPHRLRQAPEPVQREPAAEEQQAASFVLGHAMVADGGQTT
jgi:transcriptional regulator with XRE-family HTH domain